ncbi:MAG: hypothetical protein M1840_001319 [Geoglossum simile]|nr:MAG: hypothetical protein M1840_001319 [Geoglossum simile]
MGDLAIGTDGWKGFSETSYETERLVRDYEQTINWGIATSFCATRRHGPCRIGPDFVVGSSNLIRIVEFEDGVKWVLKVPLPPLDIYSIRTSPTSRLAALRSEVATMKANTSIPVPEIYGFDNGSPGGIGVPCITMEYMHGTPANILLKGGREAFGPAEQDQYILKQMASIVVQLAEVRFTGLGSIYQNEADGEFYIGPELETGEGPFYTARGYYNALCNHRQTHFGMEARGSEPENLGLPQLFGHYLENISDMDGRGPFSLINTNFGGHNLLVDSNRKVVSYINFENIIAAPFAMGGVIPMISPVNDPLPGERHAVDKRTELAIMRRSAYAYYIWEQGQIGGPHQKRMADQLHVVIESDAPHYIRGLNEFKMRDWSRNARWVHAFKHMYDGYLDCMTEIAHEEEEEARNHTPITDEGVPDEVDLGYCGSLPSPTPALAALPVDQQDVVTTPPQITLTFALRAKIHGGQSPDSGAGIDERVVGPCKCDNGDGFLEAGTF